MDKISPVKFVRNHEIDKHEWNYCINQCSYGLLYAQAFYLDIIFKDWHALIGHNYEWVMPITSRKKYGVSYLCQPPFTQQLGVFAKEESKIPWEEIMSYLKIHYPFCEINLNYNTPLLVQEKLEHFAATNFVILLQNGYAEMSHKYHSVLKKNLKKASHANLVCKPYDDYKKCINEYAGNYAVRMKHLTANDFKNFEKICEVLFIENKLVCRAVMNEQDELMATAIILFDGRRLYNMMNTPTASGRRVQANHFLIDAVIQEFAGQNVTFDFEGSDLPGVKGFYESFNATNQPYFMVKYNNLPWPLRLFK